MAKVRKRHLVMERVAGDFFVIYVPNGSPVVVEFREDPHPDLVTGETRIKAYVHAEDSVKIRRGETFTGREYEELKGY